MDQDYMDRMLERHEHQMLLEEERFMFPNDKEPEVDENQLYQDMIDYQGTCG